ncbi:transposase [Sediminicola sp. YIK13]|uniref:REP-associated tyrosine transposase n=1 Tax=Sediminicola sp. YIK13 TaxID=1453352 RepID=UPI00071F055D|nr:transposase [Sediminicola sp. YIK13]ALM07811.1 transposase [Sediminicola sp. YIK13]
MSRKYKFHNPTAAYFVSFATVYWIDVFTRQPYFSILERAIEHCRKEKGMEVFAYCFMPSHVHLIFRSNQGNPSGLLRDFKGFTAKKLINEIEENPQESRKEWLLWMMERAGKKKSNVSKRQFWQQHNKPIELWSDNVIKQKIDYIHYNPVEQGFVTDPVEWKYSSARNFVDDHTILKIDNDGIDLGFL